MPHPLGLLLETAFAHLRRKRRSPSSPHHGLRACYQRMLQALAVLCLLWTFHAAAGAISVSNVSPSIGSHLGGTSVTLTGSGFTGTTGVSFEGNPAQFTVSSDTTITATVPAHAPGTVSVVVTNPSGSALLSSAFTYIVPPVANDFSVTVPYNSPYNYITSHIPGTFDSVAVYSAPLHGSVSSSGTSISHSPITGYAGSDTFKYIVTNAAGTSSPATVSVTVSRPTLTYSVPTFVIGTVGLAYSQSLPSPIGGSGPYTYAIASGSLPSGLTLSSNGVLSGTPTAAGTFSFTIRATDSSTGTGPFSVSSTPLTLLVQAPTIEITPGSLPAASVGTAYSSTITASGSMGPYSFSISAGALPTGVSLSSSGTLSGTPTQAGSFNFTVTGTDSLGFTGSRIYTLSLRVPTLSLSPSSGSSFTGSAGSSFSQSFGASGGQAPYQFAAPTITTGTMPNGLSFDTATGTLTGTPTSAGTVTFQIKATDSTTGAGPASQTGSYTLTIAAPTIALSPAGLQACPMLSWGRPTAKRCRPVEAQRLTAIALQQTRCPRG